MDLQTRAILNEETAAARGAENGPDAKTVWLRRADRVVRQGGTPLELLATAALRPQGFEKPV